MKFIRWSRHFVIIASACLLANIAYSQLSQYVSPEDNSLTFDDIEILNYDDNAGGAYAKPLMEMTAQFFDQDRRYHAEISPLLSPSLAELEENPKDLITDAKLHARRAYIKTQLIKGPKGIRIRTTLFTGPLAEPLIVAEKTESQMFDLDSIKQIYKAELEKILNSLPYQARVLSRRENQVTINAGAIQGLAKDQDVLVIQVIHIERHPVLHFATQFQREIMGKIHLTKVDESLSFGVITFEKTPALIAPDFKITFHENVTYEAPDGNRAGKSDFHRTVPTIGQAEVLAGLSKLDAQTNLATQGSVSAEDSTTPTVLLRGEIWLTQNWYSQLSLQEYIATLKNGLAGSTPSSLNAQVLRTTFNAGYRFLMQDDFFGPSINLGLGYSKTKFSIADSTPTALTSQDYSSFALVVGGKFPIDLASGQRFYLGADFMYHLGVTLAENPGSSGGSSSSHIASIDFFGNYPLKDNLLLTAMIQFDQFNTNFTGTGTRTPEPATSSSLNFLSLLGGVTFQF